MFIMKNIKLHTLLLAASLLCLSVGSMEATRRAYTKNVLAACRKYQQDVVDKCSAGDMQPSESKKRMDDLEKEFKVGLAKVLAGEDPNIDEIDNSKACFTYNISDMRGNWVFKIKTEPTLFEDLLTALEEAQHDEKKYGKKWAMKTTPKQKKSWTMDYFWSESTFGPADGKLTISYKENHGKLEEYEIIFTRESKHNDKPLLKLECTIQVRALNKKKDEKTIYDIKKITLKENNEYKKESLTTYEDAVTPWGFIVSTQTNMPTIYLKKRVFKDKDGTHEVYETLKDKKEYDKELLKRKIVYHFFTFPWNRNKPEKRGW